MTMTRKQFLQGVAAATLVGGIGGGDAADAAAVRIRRRRRRNILVIVVDQERAWADLPAGLDVPARRQLAAQAVHFTKFHVNTVPCSPSRSVMWTGQHVTHTGVIGNISLGFDLDPARTPTVASVLRKYGYYTALKGKWHLTRFKDGEPTRTDSLDACGFDEWQAGSDTEGDALQGFNADADIARAAVEFIERKDRKAGQPWFLSVNFINPHDIMWFDATGRQQATRVNPGYASPMKPAPAAAPFDEDLGVELPRNFDDDLATKPAIQRHFVEWNSYFFGDLPRSDRDAYRRVQNFYFNCVRHNDQFVGQVLAALRRSGQDEDTIVVFTSDHGEMAAAHGMRNKGEFLYKESVGVPLLIRHPEGARGVRTNAQACALDLTPTLLDLAGVPMDEVARDHPAMRGVSLLESVFDPAADRRRRERGGSLLVFNNANSFSPKAFRDRLLRLEAARAPGGSAPKFEWPWDYLQFENRGFGRGYFDGRYKFGRWFSPGDHHRPTTYTSLLARNDVELYDTAEDPDELVNLAWEPGRHRALIERLNEQLNRLAAVELGADVGDELVGKAEWWRLVGTPPG